MMDLLKILLSIFLFILAYFVYSHGTEILGSAGLDGGTLAHLMIVLITLAIVLLGLLLLAGAMKWRIGKIIANLLIVSIIAIGILYFKLN